jgi:pimeloyl-ACP methyl ester carboxylesterase/photosystem II stability/assembly factor-like uncharacterized protein
MKRKYLILLPSILAAFYLSVFPAKTFASTWSIIGSLDKTVSSFAVSAINKNEILFSNVDGVFYTNDGGISWNSSSFSPTTVACAPLLQSNQNQNEYWAGCNGLYHSTDQGHTFQRINNPYFNVNNIRRIKQDKDGTLYLTVNSSTNYRSRDGLIWENLSGPGNYSNQYFPDPSNSGVIYLSSYYYGTKGLYKSINYGANWTKIGDDYSINNGVNSLLFFSDRICAAVNSYGYGCSNDGGITWQGFNNRSDRGIPSIFNNIYTAYQNPDDPENVFVFTGDVNGNGKRLYSIKPDALDWAYEELPAPISKLMISQGVIFGTANNNVFGLWKNEGLATLPEYLKKHPVIIVPGILGSDMKNGQLVLEPMLHTYDALYNSLKGSGLEENKFLFTFPYNWRNDNKETAKLLKEKINEAIAASGESKVDIVAHSMGGLVAREYAESDYYENDINKIIFLGTPHLGSAKAYVIWESGDVKFGNNVIVANYFNYIFGKEASQNNFSGPNKIFNYIRNMVPSVAQLLPISSYLERSGIMGIYPDGYPNNEFLEELENKKALIKNRNIKTTNIIGIEKNNTIYKYGVENSSKAPLWEHGEPVNFYNVLLSKGIYYTSGDDTVTTESSSNVGDKIVTLNNIKHTEMPGIYEVISKVEDELVLDQKVISDNQSTKKGIMIFVHSPVDILITDSQGRRVGTDPTTGQKFNEVNGAYYNNQNDSEYAILPNSDSGLYKITAIGVNQGEYRIESHYLDINEELDVESSYIGATEAGRIETLEVNLDINSKSINIKPEDKTPPVINLTLTPSISRWENLEIRPEVTDDQSGVKKYSVSLDGELIESEDVCLFNINFGKHEVLVTAEDNVGNSTSRTFIFEVYTNFFWTNKDLAWLTKEKQTKNFGEIMRLREKLRMAEFFDTIGLVEKRNSFLENAISELEKINGKKYITGTGYKILLEDINYLEGK